MNKDAAQALALQALAFVAGDEDALTRLLAESGLSQDDLAGRAGDPELLGFVIDFVLARDTLAMAFCRVARVTPDLVKHARAELPGGVGDWA